MAVSICLCRCHGTLRGTAKAAQHMGRYMKGIAYTQRADLWDEMGCVEASDPLEAAIASGCNCINNHCPALSSIPKPKRRPRIVKRFDPDGDSQTTDADTQADGEKGNEDGG